MKVVIEYTETWTRRAEHEIDEAEFRAWLGEGSEVAPEKVQEFLEADREFGSVIDMGWPHRTVPSTEDGDDFDGIAIDEVSIP